MDVDDNIFNNSGNDIDITCYSLLNTEKEFIYDGKVNIWVNKKNIALFPEYRDDINAVNILKSKPGYFKATLPLPKDEDKLLLQDIISPL